MRPRSAPGRPGAARLALLPVLLAAATLAAATQAAGGARPAGASVVLRDIAFTPGVTRIRAGQRVTWTWDDPYVTHDLRAVGRPRFPGATARRTGLHVVRFTRGGTYRYVCTLHPGMAGRVVVR